MDLESYTNRKAAFFLAITGVAFLLGWIVGVALFSALVRDPSIWVPLTGALWFLGLWVFLVSRIPVAVEVWVDTLVLRRLLLRKKLERHQISRIDYRIPDNYLEKPVDLRYYTISIRGRTKRLAEVGADGRIAHRLMTWFDPGRSTLKVYHGRKLIEERSLQT